MDHILRCLYQILTEARKHHGDELAIILAGPLREELHAAPALAARFPAVIDFPGYTPAQLTAILQALATEAGLTLTPDAARKAAAVLAGAERGHGTGNARLAVQLLTQATINQAHRVTTTPSRPTRPASSRAPAKASRTSRWPGPPAGCAGSQTILSRISLVVCSTPGERVRWRRAATCHGVAAAN